MANVLTCSAFHSTIISLSLSLRMSSFGLCAATNQNDSASLNALTPGISAAIQSKKFLRTAAPPQVRGFCVPPYRISDTQAHTPDNNWCMALRYQYGWLYPNTATCRDELKYPKPLLRTARVRLNSVVMSMLSGECSPSETL